MQTVLVEDRQMSRCGVLHDYKSIFRQQRCQMDWKANSLGIVTQPDDAPWSLLMFAEFVACQT